MPIGPAMRNQKALTEVLAPGFILLLASVFGLFILRTFQRQRLGKLKSHVLVGEPHGSKPQLTTTTMSIPLTRGNEFDTNDLPNFQTRLEERQCFEFLSQLPAPTLMYNLPAEPVDENHQPTTFQNENTTVRRSVYQDTPIAASGRRRRDVLEQHFDPGNGRQRRRKMVVYSG